MIRILVILLAATLVLSFVNQNEEDTERILNSDKELSHLRGKFGLLFEPDKNRGESQAALRHILLFLNKRPGVIQPSAAGNVCDVDDASSQWNSGGYTAKSHLPAIIGSMKEDAVYNIF